MIRESEERPASLFVIPPMLVIVGIFLFIALLNGQRELIVLMVLVLSVAGGARLWSRYSLTSLKCSVFLEKDRLFPGETFMVNIQIENEKFLPVWAKVTLPVGGPVSLSLDGDGPVQESGLLWRQLIKFPWQLKAERRGLHSLGPPRVIAGDLLGFFPRDKQVEAPDIVIYPRIVPLVPFPVIKKDLFGVPGAKSPVQDPVYILGTIDYQHGQPARHIHWKASARHNKLQQKIFDPSEQAKVLLLIDVGGFFEQGDEEAFEESLEVMASLALELDRRGYALGLRTNGSVDGAPSILPVARNPHQMPAILEMLARLRMVRERNFSEVLRQSLPLARGVTCVLFAYEADEKVEKTGDLLLHYKIPASLIVSRVSQEGTGRTLKFSAGTYPIDKLALKGGTE